ncbi:hypothetical protein C0995_005634, partial [Termitomyces sp. Mi166
MGGEARQFLFSHKGYIGRDFQLSSPPLDRWVAHAIDAVKEWIETELAKSSPKKPKLTAEGWMGPFSGTLPPSLPVETEPTPMAPRILDGHKMMAELFANCLRANHWPTPADDKPYDILPDLLAEEKAKRALELEGEEEDI